MASSSIPNSAPQDAGNSSTVQQEAEHGFGTHQSSTHIDTANAIPTSSSQPHNHASTQPPSATTRHSQTTEVPLSADPLQSTTITPQVPEPAHLSSSSDNNAATPSTQPPPQPSSPPLTRKQTEAIGPSTDNPHVHKADPSGSPVVSITLLLTSGARHPYTIDERYLKKRNVAVDGMDPFNISVYTLKELIWKDWREEWDPRPSSPSSIRLISFGRLLEDNKHLKDCRFNPTTANVVHMTVRPQDLIDEEEAHAKSGKGSFMGRGDRGDDERTTGCRCVIL